MGGGKKPKAPSYVNFTSADLEQLSPEAANAMAEEYSRQYYAESDADQASRNSALVRATQAQQGQFDRLEGQSQQQADTAAGLVSAGESDLANATNIPPEILAAYTRAGLGDALGTMTGAIAPGSAGSYGIARNLGVNALDYTKSRESQALAKIAAGNSGYGLSNSSAAAAAGSLATASELSPQRSFGLSGADAVNLQQSNYTEGNTTNANNAKGLNQFNQSNYATEVAAGAKKGGLGSSIGSIAGGLIGSFIMPGIGTALGAGLGGALGGMAG